MDEKKIEFNFSDYKFRFEENYLYVYYRLSEEHAAEDIEESAKDFERINELLSYYGLYLSITGPDTGKFLHVILNLDKLKKHHIRGAGRREKFIHKQDCTGVNYSDIVLMMNNMTDKQICEELNLKPATYYRRKKIMKESEYFQTLDPEKLSDPEYLKSHKGNRNF